MEKSLRESINRKWMLAGVTLKDPDTTYIDESVAIGKDTVIGPNTQLRGKTVIGERCRIDGTACLTDVEIGDGVELKFSVMLTGSRIGAGAIIGPFAQLRPGTELGRNVHIGNFVEAKAAQIGDGTKANHLTYLGDVTIGRDSNIGAGTITCNYDGFQKYKTKIGDRVQCDRTDMQAWETGTVVPLRKTDFQDGRIYRVLLDSYSKAGLYLDGHDCTVERMRPLAGAAPFKGQTPAIPVGNVTIDDENTVSADRPIMECPVPQTKVKNGAGPNIDVFKKIIRCRKGEKPAARKGADGAVTVEVTSLVPGATRPWEYGRDMGGKPGTIIHPVKATFHYKTFYRSSTQVSQNWISIINFYVNVFGEWETGSEESIKMGDTINIPRQQ
jgi:acyl-[acyl carrier protein]--UDP-N-acetylglucosamine O-acyltransferase